MIIHFYSLRKRSEDILSRLNAIFVQNFGIGPMKYFQQMRLNYAIKLMQAPYLTSQEIATVCGYDDANYFSRLFKKKYNQTPSDYRMEN